MKIAGSVLLLLAMLAAGCKTSQAERALDAAQDEARQTPVADPVREYAAQQCDLSADFLAAMQDTFDDLQKAPASEAELDESSDAFAGLKEPLQDMRDALADIDPPEELRAYHEARIAELDYSIETYDSEGVFGGSDAPVDSLSLEPPGMESALIQECGDDLADIVDSGGLFPPFD